MEESDKKSPHEGEGPGRPRINPDDKTLYTSKTIYFPLSTNYGIIWKEFERLCITNTKPFLYSRNVHWKRGIIIRRLIMNYVLTNTKNENVSNIVKDMILQENKDRINKWEKDNGKKYKPTQ